MMRGRGQLVASSTLVFPRRGKHTIIMAARQPWPTQCLDEGKHTFTEHSSGCSLPVAPWSRSRPEGLDS